jgi:hypothetical protein
VRLDGWPEAGDYRLKREPLLQERWVLTVERPGKRESMPFFDKGLVELLVRGLGLPRPEAPAGDSVERPYSSRLSDVLLGKHGAAAVSPSSGTPKAREESSPEAPAPRPRRL